LNKKNFILNVNGNVSLMTTESKNAST
jgi:hypothetical protein